MAVFQRVRKILARKLGSLVGIEDLRDSDGKGIVQCFNAEGCIQGDRYIPGEHIATKPVHDRREVDEALSHGNVGDVGRKDLIGSDNIDSPQKIGVDRMFLIGDA